METTNMNSDAYHAEQMQNLLNYSNARLEQCAEEGDALSCCALAYKLYEENPEASMMWAKRGIDGGDATAAFLLGRHFMEGVGVEQDATVALDYFRQAADMGSNAALLFAAGLLLEVEPVNIDEILGQSPDGQSHKTRYKQQ